VRPKIRTLLSKENHFPSIQYLWSLAGKNNKVKPLFSTHGVIINTFRLLDYKERERRKLAGNHKLNR
jgi:hypothetical protein